VRALRNDILQIMTPLGKKLAIPCVAWLAGNLAAFGESTPPVLSAEAIRRHVATFNQHDHTHFGQAVSNEDAARWMEENVPRFDCPDRDIGEIYHFRWWTWRGRANFFL